MTPAKKNFFSSLPEAGFISQLRKAFRKAAGASPLSGAATLELSTTGNWT
jgi:hypothetical protein